MQAPIATVICCDCSKSVRADENEREYQGNPLCDDCYYSYYITCNDCGEVEHQERAQSLHDDYYCRDCDTSCECDECCADDYAGNWDERLYFRGNSRKYQSQRALGKIVRSRRLFSTEIESYAPDSEAYQKVLQEIPEGIGATDDGSLGDKGREFQTPKLKGKKGEEVIKTLCASLNKHKFTVNSDCGLHIHLDGAGLSPSTLSKHEPVALKQLWAFYHVYEPVILSFLPKGRRNNQFCKPLQDVSKLGSVTNAKTLRQLEAHWYREDRPRWIDERKKHKYDDTRYTGVNLHSLLGHKHLEIRYHSGTLNSVKILEWINLHLTIMDRASAGELDIDTMIALGGASIEALTVSFFRALGLSKKSQAYFVRRQEKFTNGQNTEVALEANEIQPICVE